MEKSLCRYKVAYQKVIMDAYILQQKLLEAWRQVAFIPDAASVNKKWDTALVNVDGKVVKDVVVVDGNIYLVTE